MNKRIAIVAGVLALAGLAHLQKEPIQMRTANRVPERIRVITSSSPAAMAKTSPAHQFGVALSDLDFIQEEELRDEALQKISETIALGEIPDILNELITDSSFGGAALREMLLARWTTNAPANAAAWALSQTNHHAELSGLVATVWAGLDAEKARQWANHLPEEEIRTKALEGVGYEASRTQPHLGFAVLEQMEQGPERDSLLEFSVSQWASAEPDAALKWAKTLPPGELTDQIITAIVISTSSQMPDAAADLAAESIGNSSQLESTAVSIVQRWAQTDPSAAAAWVAQFPDSPIRQDATENLLTLWVVQDKDAAWEWVKHLPEGQQEQAITAYNNVRVP